MQHEKISKLTVAVNYKAGEANLPLNKVNLSLAVIVGCTRKNMKGCFTAKSSHAERQNNAAIRNKTNSRFVIHECT
jgi:hypothetical protein